MGGVDLGVVYTGKLFESNSEGGRERGREREREQHCLKEPRVGLANRIRRQSIGIQ